MVHGYRRVIYILCSSKYRRGLDPNLVKGLIPHLEAIVSTYLKYLSPKSLLGLYPPYIIVVLLGLVVGLLGLLQFLF